MRITHDLIAQCNFYVSPLYERTLDMRGFQIQEIDNLSATLDCYDAIDLSNNLIEILNSYATLKNLKTLICNFNKIYIIKSISEAFPNLENLVLMNNQIKQIEDVKELSKLKNIKRIYLNNNPVVYTDEYRLKLIAMLPKLKILDFQKVSMSERKLAKNKYEIKQEENLDVQNMSRKQKLQKLIQQTQKMEDILELEKLINNEQLTDEILDEKLKQFNYNQLMLSFRIKEYEKKELSKEQQKKSNKVSTTLYRIWNFIPLGLYNQFRQITNCYFLAIAILNVIPYVTAVDPYSAFIPVGFVIFFSLLFDWVDDLKRFFSDRKTNNAPVLVIRDGEYVETVAKKIEIGDFLIVKENERFEADVILMTFRSPNDQCFIDTCSLDGEKALKNKLSVLQISIQQKHFLKVDKNQALNDLEIKYDQNTADLNHFAGNISIQIQKDDQNQNISERLNKQNFIPRSSYLRSTLEVVGLVVYVGKDTKVVKNTQQRIYKKSSLFKQMQRYIMLILIALLGLTLSLSIIAVIKRSRFNYTQTVLKKQDGATGFFIKTFLTYILLMNTLLPISLIITLQLLNLVQNLSFKSEKKFDEYQSNKTLGINTVNINEELGQIEYVLSDKTGTLTQNLMIARYFLIGEYQYTLKKYISTLSMFKDSTQTMDSSQSKNDMFFVQDKNQNLDVPNQHFETQVEEQDLNSAKTQTNGSIKTDNFSQQSFQFEELCLESQDGQSKQKFENQDLVNELFFCILNSCHECFSTNKEGKNFKNQYDNLKEHIQYQGQSPDEIALLTGCKNNCGMLMKGADNKKILLYSRKSQDFEIQKIFNFPFDNFRKRMSNLVLIKDQYYLVMKGADHSVSSVCNNKLKKSQLEFFDYYLQQGLRVMLIAVKLLSKQEVEKFLQTLNKLEKEQSDEDTIYQHQLQLEQNMYLLGATAVEDKLQENLKETVDLMKLAQMKVWVITGDKTETAVNIAYSSGLFDKEHYPPVFFDKELFENQLQHQPTQRKTWRQLTKGIAQSKTFKKMQQRDSKHGGIMFFNYLKKRSTTNKNLVVENEILKLVLENKNHRQQFTKYIKSYECVVFAKTNPNEKVEIVRLLKENGKKVLAIGDGANDVNMIQEANVGVGIIGEEGQQAQNAADYAIPKFKNLQILLFSFGRISYYRNTQFILLFFYKNILFTIPQFYYAFFSNFSRVNIWNDWYMSCFNLLFTATNVVALAVSNHDLPLQISNTKQKLTIQSMTYFQGQSNFLFTKKRFFGWILVACLESLLVIFLFYIIIGNNIIDKNNDGDYNFFSYTFYSVIIFYVNLKLILISFSYAFIFVLGILISIVSFIVYTYATNNSTSFGYYQTLDRTLQSDFYWITVLFLIGILFIFNIIYYTLKRYIYPNINGYVRKIHKNFEFEKVIKDMNKKRVECYEKNWKNTLLYQLNQQLFMNIFRKILSILFLTQIIMNQEDFIDLDDLETKDTDQKVVKNVLLDTYFRNKYKIYSFENLRQFYYHNYLGNPEIPSMEQMKKWSPGKTHNLELIDEFLEDHRQDQYTQQQILQIINQDKFKEFKTQRYKEIYQFASAHHNEESAKHYEEQKNKKKPERVRPKRDNNEFKIEDL